MLFRNVSVVFDDKNVEIEISDEVRLQLCLNASCGVDTN